MMCRPDQRPFSDIWLFLSSVHLLTATMINARVDTRQLFAFLTVSSLSCTHKSTPTHKLANVDFVRNKSKWQKVEKSPSANNLKKNYRTFCGGSEGGSGRRSPPAFNVCIQWSARLNIAFCYFLGFATGTLVLIFVFWLISTVRDCVINKRRSWTRGSHCDIVGWCVYCEVCAIPNLRTLYMPNIYKSFIHQKLVAPKNTKKT